MTKEEKELLLKDICGRLPYGVFVDENIEKLDKDPVIYMYDYHPYIDRCKPYLRPMGSMTEGEKRELSKKYVWKISCGQIEIRYHSGGYWDDDTECPTSEYLNLFDWLNKKMFDYRGLIPMGLALPAKEGMYK